MHRWKSRPVITLRYKPVLAQSRSLKFACDGTIIVVPELVIVHDTVLDAAGHNVTLNCIILGMY
jgi:hypothetical protein